ncbi:MAG: hypothetical protein EXS16_03005 [Gemmataceae bacterium]|nr:hypothetical protein [Gemmataceae bacterium]
MPKIPAAMKMDSRRSAPDAAFPKAEFLFRRVPLGLWDDASQPVEVNAVELPDISCGRSKYGHPEWLRLDRVNGNDRYFEGWGVIGFQVSDIPPERWDLGVFQFTFTPFHAPEEWNYPHSEIRVFAGERHIDLLDVLPEDIHLEWRELLLRHSRCS